MQKIHINRYAHSCKEIKYFWKNTRNLLQESHLTMWTGWTEYGHRKKIYFSLHTLDLLKFWTFCLLVICCCQTQWVKIRNITLYSFFYASGIWECFSKGVVSQGISLGYGDWGWLLHMASMLVLVGGKKL